MVSKQGSPYYRLSTLPTSTGLTRAEIPKPACMPLSRGGVAFHRSEEAEIIIANEKNKTKQPSSGDDVLARSGAVHSISRANIRSLRLISADGQAGVD